MNNTTFTNDLTQGNVTKQLIYFSIPFLFANFLQTCYSLADMIIVGRVVGSAGLSAISNGGDLQNLFLMLGFGLSSGGQIIISQYVGAKDDEGVKNTIGTLFTCIFILSLCVMAIGLRFTDTFLMLLRVPSEALSQANAYCTICFCGILFTYGYNAISSILRGMGDSKHPLLFIAISTSLNVVLDLLFVVGMDMGAKGAALATITGQAVAFIISILFLYRRRESFGFDFSLSAFIPKSDILKLIAKLGIPLAIRAVAVNFSMLFVTSYINTFGVAVSAITGIGNKIANIATMVTNSLEMAGSSMIGQNFAAGKPDRVKQVFHISVMIGLVFCLFLSSILLLFPQQVFQIWSDDPEVLAFVPIYLPAVILNLIGFSLRAPCLSLVNGIGFVSLNFAVGILDGVVFRIGLALLFGKALGFGISGFWYGTVLAGFTSCFIIGPYYFSGKWQNRKPVISQ